MKIYKRMTPTALLCHDCNKHNSCYYWEDTYTYTTINKRTGEPIDWCGELVLCPTCARRRKFGKAELTEAAIRYKNFYALHPAYTEVRIAEKGEQPYPAENC